MAKDAVTIVCAWMKDWVLLHRCGLATIECAGAGYEVYTVVDSL